MFDLVLLLVQLSGSEEVVGGLVILHSPNQQQHPETIRLYLQSPRTDSPPCNPTLYNLCDLKHLFHSTKYHTLCRPRKSTFRGERFTGASLTVRENADVVSVDAALSELGDIFKDFRKLGRMWFENLE